MLFLQNPTDKSSAELSGPLKMKTMWGFGIRERQVFPSVLYFGKLKMIKLEKKIACQTPLQLVPHQCPIQIMLYLRCSEKVNVAVPWLVCISDCNNLQIVQTCWFRHHQQRVANSESGSLNVFTLLRRLRSVSGSLKQKFTSILSVVVKSMPTLTHRAISVKVIDIISEH